MNSFIWKNPNAIISVGNYTTETRIQIDGRAIKMVYKEFSAVGDNILAQSSTGINFINANILRQKDDSSWAIVYSNLDNEVYVNKTNQIRFNIKELAGYWANIKILVEYT